jgi:hypothetical protein
MNPLDPSVQQNVTGDRNQAIGQAVNSTIINELNLQQPRSLESARYSLPIDPDGFIERDREIQRIDSKE